MWGWWPLGGTKTVAIRKPFFSFPLQSVLSGFGPSSPPLGSTIGLMEASGSMAAPLEAVTEVAVVLAGDEVPGTPALASVTALEDDDESGTARKSGSGRPRGAKDKKSRKVGSGRPKGSKDKKPRVRRIDKIKGDGAAPAEEAEVAYAMISAVSVVAEVPAMPTLEAGA